MVPFGGVPDFNEIELEDEPKTKKQEEKGNRGNKLTCYVCGRHFTERDWIKALPSSKTDWEIRIHLTCWDYYVKS